MNEATPQAPQTRPIRRTVGECAAAHPRALHVGGYAIIAFAAAVAAYFTIFIQFSSYDDEGTLLVTVKAFVEGDPLYREIVSAYGPFYYELFGGLFAFTGLDVSTNVSRCIVVFVWVATSLLFGFAVQRLTGLLVLGMTGMIAAFATLFVLLGEPMHPHGLCVLLLGAFILLVVRGPGKKVALVGGACGALLAALTLTKVNLGAFAIAAVAFAAVLTVEPLYRRQWVRWPVVVAFVALPVVIMARDLDLSWVRDLTMVEILAAVAILVAAWPLQPKAGENEDAAPVQWLRALGVGFAIAGAAILGAIMLTGPSPGDLYDGIVGDALRIRSVLLSPLPMSAATVYWGIAAVAAAALVVRWRSFARETPTIWPGLLRIAAGLTIWFTVARIAPIGLNPAAGNPDTLPLVLAWIAAIPPLGAREPAYRRFVRVLLPALAMVETLQVYPVAGSQMGIASLLFVPVGALCLADGLVALRAWSTAHGSESGERFGVVAGVATLALAAMFAYGAIVRPAATNAVIYRQQEALPFDGATMLRLPPSEIETYAGVVDLLHRHRCTSFIGYPSVDSLYLWSGIESPPPQVPSAWMKAFDSQRQQRVVDELRASPRPCAIRSDQRAYDWLHGEPPPARPLVNYIFNDFKPVAQSGDFQFLLPR